MTTTALKAQIDRQASPTEVRAHYDALGYRAVRIDGHGRVYGRIQAQTGGLMEERLLSTCNRHVVMTDGRFVAFGS